ncbi:MAG: flagellar hook-associated protein FlgL [Peptostreptococcaceae bacterium]|nr:flagellar hook-associated protein FlgL [Peptostreptococcaceae bacterium]
MRVTNSSIMANYLYNLNRNLENMQKFQNQLSTGKEITRPSDDPFLATRALDIQTSIDRNDQYLRNIEDSSGWTEMTDSALGGMGDMLQKIRELTVYGANGTLAPEDMKAIANEVGQNIEAIAQIGNTNYDGRYVLAGQKTTEPPFSVSGYMLAYGGDDGALNRELSENVTMDVSVSGGRLTDGSVESLGDTLKNIMNRLESGQNSELSSDSLEKLDEHLENLLSLRAEIGAKYNRLQAAKSKNEAETINLTELLSETEDIDMAEKIMEFSMMENVYQASLATGARILQPSLLDYLR